MVRLTSANKPPRKEGGQALVEYALIIALVAIAILGIIALTGPAVGNVFSNAVWNLLNQTVTPYDTLSPAQLETYIAAVASYTPPPRGQAATGSPYPTSTRQPTNTPVGSYTPTFTKTPTTTPTLTATGPTVTPVDVQFNTNNVYPVVDETGWHYDTFVNGGKQEPSRARILWQVDYFNNTTWSGAPVATDTLNDHLKFDWGTNPPRTGVNADNFSIRYTAKSFSDGLVTIPFTAAETWQVRVTGNQYAKVTIAGSVVVTLPDQGADTVGTKVGYYTASTSGRKSVVVEAYEGTGNASLEVVINRVADYGNCHWQTSSSEYHSGYVAWADSGETSPQLYRPNGSCSLRQRGWYDLTNTSAIPNPRLIFWNRWKLNTGDSLQVGVRKYDDPTDHWTWAPVQTAIGSNFNWNRQIVDLKSFPAAFDDENIGTALGSQPGSLPITNKDFSGHKVEIAFRVVTDAANEEDGWYVDDIGVFNWDPLDGNYPYVDQVNRGTAPNWVNECKWQIIDDVAASRTYWTTGTYTSGSDCPLTLDRKITIPLTDPDTPLLEFDAKTKLDSGDQVRVEWALPTSDLMSNASWHPLPKIGSPAANTCITPPGTPGTDYSLYCSTVNMAWENIKVDLSPLRGSTVMLRFRLYADTSGNPPTPTDGIAYGWNIDNVWIHPNTVNTVALPFIEPFTTSTNWTLNGWALTSGSDPTRSSPTALTDSPNGAQYTSTTNISTLLKPAVLLTGSTDPIVSFYTRWQAPTANLQLDMSADDGFTWAPIWQFDRTTLGDENRAWERFEVRLVDALASLSPSRTLATTPRVMFRFRMLATGSVTVADGFYIDDFRVEESPAFLTKTLNAGNNFTIPNTLDGPDTPKSESANPTNFDWHVGGDWSLQPTVGHNGTAGWTDSNGTGVNYNNPLRSILEYRVPFNTSAAQFPAVTFWTKYNMGSGHTFAVDLKGNNGAWTQVWSNLDASVATPSNLGWHRVVVAINPSLAQPVRVRFRLLAMDSVPPGDGIYLDDIDFVDRAVWTDFNTIVPGFITVADQNKWITEGDWKVPVTSSPVIPALGTLYGKPEVKISTLSSITAATVDWGGSIGSTSQWATQYWHTNAVPPWVSVAGTQMNWTALLATSPQLSQINTDLTLDVATDPTNLPIPPGVTAWNTGPAKNDWYAIRYRRRFNGSGGTYLLRLDVRGGAEVLVGGTVIAPNTGLPRPYVTDSSPSSTGSSSLRTYYYTTTIGSNTEIEVRFWHSTDALVGTGKVEFGIAEARSLAKTSRYATPPLNKYTHLTKTSLILDGYVTIPAGRTGAVSYDERWSLEQTDYATAYYSIDRGSTWIMAPGTQHGPNSPAPDANGVSTQDWVTTTYTVSNGGASPVRMMLKWELDARNNTAVADGWLVDNVIFSIPASASNVGPTASALNASTVANTATADIAPTVTDANLPLDYFKVAVTSAPKRGTATVTTIAGATDTVRYTPFGDWTGIDNTMLHRVTDSGGIALSGQPATFTVDPKFHAGLDIGDTSGGSVGTVYGNTWYAQNGTSIALTFNGTAGAVGSVSPSVGTATDNMLKDYIKATDAATGLRVRLTNVPSGMYSVYLYWVNSEASAQTYDVYLQGSTDVASGTYKGDRVENNMTTGATGTYTRTGPYTLKVASDIVVRAEDGGIAALAGVELYQGGSYTNFTHVDVNPVSLGETTAGASSVSGGVITISQAYGNDIWNNEDGFRYVYKAERGDIDFVVRMDSANLNTDGWAKAGVMIRSSIDPGSPHIFFGVTNQYTTPTSDNAMAVQYRTTQGGSSTSDAVNDSPKTSIAIPIWLKIEKRGNVFKVYRSFDGINYTASLGTYTVDVGTNYLYGVAVTAHTNGAAASAQFSNVTVTLQ